MKLSFVQYDVHCTHPFGISRNTHESYPEIFIYLEQDGLIGRGETSPSERYGESVEKIISLLENGFSFPDAGTSPEEFESSVLTQCQDIKSLEMGLSMAYLDWWTQNEGISMKNYLVVVRISKLWLY